jgi:zinc protease
LSTNIKDKNSYALKVLNFIIAGGGFGSRLMDKIREKEGLAYGVFSNFFIDRLMNGYFFVGTQTENKNVDKVISIITNELRDIVQNGVSGKELEDAKNFAKGSLPLSMESFSSLSSYLLTEKLYGLERNYFIKSIKEISVIKIDDLKRVAREYINLDKLSFVVVKGE